MELDNNLNINIENYSLDQCVDDLANFLETLNLKTTIREEEIDNKTKIKQYLLDYFYEIKKDIVFDLKEHFNVDGKTLEEISNQENHNLSYRTVSYMFETSIRRIGFMYDFKNFDKEDFKNIFNDKDEMFLISDARNCSKCDCYISYAFDMKELKLKAIDNFEKLEPCSIKKEIEYKLNLEIPSKKIVFTNYFRGLLDESRYENFSLSTYKSMIEHAKAYENDNIGYVFLTNSPNIFIDEKKQNIIVGDYYVLEEYEGYKQDNQLEDFFNNYDITQDVLNEKIKKLDKFKEVGKVCTDLWAVTKTTPLTFSKNYNSFHSDRKVMG